MSKKRIIAIFVLVVMLTSLATALVGCGTKESIKVPEVVEDVFVYDQDKCINDEIEMEINFMIKELKEKTGAEFAIVSVTSLSGYTIEEYANELFNALGIGKSGEDNGVLLLFSQSDNRVRLEIGRGLEGCLNDAKCGRILDSNFVPYREEGDYTKATRNTVIAALNVIAEEYQVELENVGEAETADDTDEDLPTWVYIVIFIIIVIVAILKPSGDGTYYGGGFSGGSSGGSFGGGRSGGGGASR